MVELVKKIIKKWKDQVTAQKVSAKHKHHAQSTPASGAAAATSTQNTSSNGATSTSSSSNSATTPSTSAGSSSSGSSSAATPAANGKTRTMASDGVKSSIHSDKVRNSCTELTYNALVIGATEPAAQVLAAAKDVEEAVFAGEKGTTPGYRVKFRSLVSNLKDLRNPNLRRRVVTGEISGKKLYTMSPQEMASDDIKKDIEQFKKENLFNAQAAVEKRAITDRFTCGRCKQKKVSYFQMQTRSADEPLTTFCTCENCGKRWKFS